MSNLIKLSEETKMILTVDLRKIMSLVRKDLKIRVLEEDALVQIEEDLTRLELEIELESSEELQSFRDVIIKQLLSNFQAKKGPVILGVCKQTL